jgi:hypothetical protein
MPSEISAVEKGRKTIAASQNMFSTTMRPSWRWQWPKEIGRRVCQADRTATTLPGAQVYN